LSKILGLESLPFDSEELLSIAKKAGDVAWEILLTKSPDIIDSKKNVYDIVTDIDREIELLVRDILKQTKIDILGEEYGGTFNYDKLTWVIDPVDGTANYASGMKLFGFNLALIKGDEVYLGLTYLPALDEKYWAVKGEGFWFNGNLIEKLNEAPEFIPIETNLKNPLASPNIPHRNLSCSSLTFAWVARGLIKAVGTMNLPPWDTAPGVLFNREVGNLVKPLNEKGLIFYNEMIVGDPKYVNLVLNSRPN